MGKRGRILLGLVFGLGWAIGLIWLGTRLSLGFLPMPNIMMLALLPGGVFTIIVVARLAARRFFDDGLIDGGGFAPGSGGDIDQRVLTNTIEQMVIALAAWPFVATMTVGTALTVVLGGGFAVARVLFWVGYHVSPPLRAFGFAASFYPSILAPLWALYLWL